jgi:catechol 2,3-dioxygenase-like lactoylglutathione lyase family enzyme
MVATGPFLERSPSMAIRGLHGLFYSKDAEASRAFLKDKLKLPHSDVGEGWLIFDVPGADLGVHPVEDPADAGGHDVSFYCDDIQGTVKELKDRRQEGQPPLIGGSWRPDHGPHSTQPSGWKASMVTGWGPSPRAGPARRASGRTDR